MKSITYGKRITIESYRAGKLLSTRVEIQPSIEIVNKAHLMQEMLETIKLVKETGEDISMTLVADPKSGEVIRLVRQWRER